MSDFGIVASVEAIGANGQRVRDPLTGRFQVTGGRGSRIGLIDRNRTLAKVAQESIVDALETSIVRPGVSTGRLARATGDARNITWSAEGFAVGSAAFLDRSAAKYWRTIDQGTAAVWSKPFVGRAYFVSRSRAFGSTIAGFNANGAYAGPDWSQAGASTGDKFNPMSFSKGRKFQRKGARWLGVVYIGKDIAPHDYYERGFERSGVLERGVIAYSNYFRDLLG